MLTIAKHLLQKTIRKKRYKQTKKKMVGLIKSRAFIILMASEDYLFISNFPHFTP